MSWSRRKINEERAIAELDDMADADLFELLNTATQVLLRIDFVREHLDDASVVDAVMFPDDKVRKQIASAWADFLSNRDLRSSYSTEIERNHIESNLIDAA